MATATRTWRRPADIAGDSRGAGGAYLGAPVHGA
jgi:hypothetical protein